MFLSFYTRKIVSLLYLDLSKTMCSYHLFSNFIKLNFKFSQNTFIFNFRLGCFLNFSIILPTDIVPSHYELSEIEVISWGSRKGSGHWGSLRCLYFFYALYSIIKCTRLANNSRAETKLLWFDHLRFCIALSLLGSQIDST